MSVDAAAGKSVDARVSPMKITPLGDSALLVETGDDAEKIRRLTAAILKENMPGVLDVVPAAASVAVHYDPLRFSKGDGVAPFSAVCAWLNGVGKVASGAPPEPGVERIVPVCYGGEFGPDLASLAEARGLSPEAVVGLHSRAVYCVRAVGFSPGFPYLDGLPEALHMPRKASPRVSVPAGSVGIGGAHTGIYTLETPGGWHLVGRTPLRLFRPEAPSPAWLKVGDQVRIRVISEEDFRTWKDQP